MADPVLTPEQRQQEADLMRRLNPGAKPPPVVVPPKPVKPPTGAPATGVGGILQGLEIDTLRRRERAAGT